MTPTLLAEAILGKDAEEFLNTDLGRYLLGRADLEIAEAQEELSRVSSWRRKRIQELQARIWRAQSVKAWLAQIIQDGKAAEVALSEEDATR